MIYGIKLKIKAHREKLKAELTKKKNDHNPRKIKSLERSIRNKKAQCKKLKLANTKRRKTRR